MDVNVFTQAGNNSAVIEMAYLEVFNDMEETPQILSVSKIKNALSGAGGTGRENTDNTILKVPFNPSKLSFSTGYGSGDHSTDTKAAITKKENGQVAVADNSRQEQALCVSIELIFDRTIYRKDSVLEEVEGFLAVVQNPYVRTVAFHWGNQYYKGQLKSLKANYVMFNKDGLPIRATVNFSIELI